VTRGMWLFVGFVAAVAVWALAEAASAQTFQVCTNYPTTIQQDLLDAKAELIQVYKLKATTTNGQAQAKFVELGILAMKARATQTAAAVLAAHAALTAQRAADAQELADFLANFPAPAPPAVCGDSVVDGGEACDDGPGGTCLDDCSATSP